MNNTRKHMASLAPGMALAARERLQLRGIELLPVYAARTAAESRISVLIVTM